MKVGDKVRLKVRDLPSPQIVTVTYVGHRSVKVMDDGNISSTPKKPDRWPAQEEADQETSPPAKV